MKLAKSRQDLLASGASMDWAEDFSDRGVKVIGLLEVVAAIGLVLPWALKVLPALTPLAGVNAALLLLGAGRSTCADTRPRQSVCRCCWPCWACSSRSAGSGSSGRDRDPAA